MLKILNKLTTQESVTGCPKKTIVAKEEQKYLNLILEKSRMTLIKFFDSKNNTESWKNVSNLPLKTGKRQSKNAGKKFNSDIQ